MWSPCLARAELVSGGRVIVGRHGQWTLHNKSEPSVSAHRFSIQTPFGNYHNLIHEAYI